MEYSRISVLEAEKGIGARAQLSPIVYEVRGPAAGNSPKVNFHHKPRDHIGIFVCCLFTRIHFSKFSIPFFKNETSDLSDFNAF